MGSDNWQTWVPWKKDVKTTLAAAQKQALKEHGYKTQREAMEATEPDGTASVLDIFGFSKKPEPGGCWQVPKTVVEETFSSATPTRADIEEHVDTLLEELGRGESLRLVAWAKPGKTGKLAPAEVFFSGWSFD